MIPSKSTLDFTKVSVWDSYWDSWLCMCQAPRRTAYSTAVTYGGGTARSPTHRDLKSHCNWLIYLRSARQHQTQQPFRARLWVKQSRSPWKGLQASRKHLAETGHNLGCHCNPVQCRRLLPESIFPSTEASSSRSASEGAAKGSVWPTALKTSDCSAACSESPSGRSGAWRLLSSGAPTGAELPSAVATSSGLSGPAGASEAAASGTAEAALVGASSAWAADAASAGSASTGVSATSLEAGMAGACVGATGCEDSSFLSSSSSRALRISSAAALASSISFAFSSFAFWRAASSSWSFCHLARSASCASRACFAFRDASRSAASRSASCSAALRRASCSAAAFRAASLFAASRPSCDGLPQARGETDRRIRSQGS